MPLPEMTPGEVRMEAQFQDVVARYYRAQADFYSAQGECQRLSSECQRLSKVVHIKQEVINVLLPYYPHPITPELHHKIKML